MKGDCHVCTVGKTVDFLLASSELLRNSFFLGLHPCFAGLDPLRPRVMKKLHVTRSSAVSEPRTAATTTTHFTRFLHGAAFGTYDTDNHRHGW